MKTLTLIFLFLFISVCNAAAQSTKADSTAVKSAKTDVKRFKLEKQVWKQFKQHGFGYTSDYFKPGKTNVSDTNVLNDSVYVKAFRKYAYQKTLHRHTTGHYILIFGGITTVLLLIIIAIGVGSAIAGFN
jgi:tRNA U34 2-thiouridine synthase MnmA/TrmU